MRQTQWLFRVTSKASPWFRGSGGLPLCLLPSLLVPVLLAPVNFAQGADTIPISHAPPYLLKGVPPNLVLTLDNSGSMLSANSMPEPGAANLAARRFDASDTASILNRQYYDASLVYLPPVRWDGSSYPHASFSAAPRDFFRATFCSSCQDGVVTGSTCAALCPSVDRGCTLDLSGHYAPVWQDATAPCLLDSDGLYGGAYTLDPALAELVSSAQGNPTDALADKARQLALACMHDASTPPDQCPAFYHRVLEDSSFTAPNGATQTCITQDFDAFWRGASEQERQSWTAQCLERVEVGSAGDLEVTTAETLSRRRDLLGTGGETDKTLAERNFANWYAYYRNRWLTLQTVTSRGVIDLDPSVRTTYQSLGDDTTELTRLVERFDAFGVQRRVDFYDWLFSLQADADKGLLTAAARVLDFCGEDGAYLENPGANLSEDNPVRACRNNFHLIFSDGGWDDLARPATWLTNNDGLAQPLPAVEGSLADDLGLTGYGLDASTRIYRDANSEGLADLVFHSWITDLRPEEDLVRTLIRDPVVPSGEEASYVFWNPLNDPADWQHLTTFTVGLGLQGEVSYPSGDYGDGKNIQTDGFPGNWSAFSSGPAPTAAQRVDDLWHAGINGRGGHSSARDPQALLEGFQRVVATVSSAVQGDASASAPTSNTGSAGTTRLVLQATLDTRDWTGDVRAFRVSGGRGVEPCPAADKPRGEHCEDPSRDYLWSAADRLDGNPTRGIAPRLWTTRRVVSGTAAYTSSGTKSSDAIAFGSGAWASLSEDDQRALLGLTDPDAPLPGADSTEVQEAQAVMDFIAGKPDTEPFGFRERESLVGDIINAAPVVVGPPSRIFNDPTYRAFATATANRDRREIVYAGSNNGLLHALDLASGEEIFAYVPRPLFGRLSTLTEPGYGSDPPHTNFVDGPIAEGDADLSGQGDWSSVVVGALGAGAQAVYAIRSPSLGTGAEVDANRIHLWDFTDRDDPDLGYVFGKPAIVRLLMSNGGIRWAAVFGNGYNSSEDDGRRAPGCDPPNPDGGSDACGRAVLYVLDIATGRLIAKLDTQTGRSQDPRQPSDVLAREPNGLGQPTVVGRVLTGTDGTPLGGGDLIATVAYAGDLFGNLWRFDLAGLPEGSTAERSTRVFQARGPGGEVQPITAAPALAPHPTGVGTLVLFGTGRYLGQPDVTDLSVQAFYGLWDQGGTGPVSADDLLEQELLQTDLRAVGDGASIATTVGRTSTRNAIDWSVNSGWRLDLIGPGGAQGERVVSAAQLRGDRVIFVSLVPESDPCKAGGFSWLNAVTVASGSALDDSPFDFDLNGTLDSADLLAAGSGTTVAGTSLRLAAGGIFSSPASLVLPGGGTLTLISSSEGDLLAPSGMESFGRWRVWHQIQ